MDADSLAEVMGYAVPQYRYDALCPAVNQAMREAGCLSVNRAAMMMAQVGHESGGLRYMEEIASGAAYEGRADLGNTQPGDGKRFKGHGPIQITGRANHTSVSLWAFARKLVPTASYFIDHPEELAGDLYGFLGVVWYWTVARPKLNAYADAADIVSATKAVNGGTNGLADRVTRWTRARDMGSRVTPGTVTQEVPEMAVMSWTLPAGTGMTETIPVPLFPLKDGSPDTVSTATLWIVTGWGAAHVRNMLFIRDRGPGLTPEQENWGGTGTFDLNPDDRPAWDLGPGCTSVAVAYDAPHAIQCLIRYPA